MLEGYTSFALTSQRAIGLGWPQHASPPPRISRTLASVPSGASPPGTTGQTITWHNGQTGGYASYLGLDAAQRRAVIVLSDVATDSAITNLGIALPVD